MPEPSFAWWLFDKAFLPIGQAVWRFLRRHRRRLSEEDRLTLRQKWKASIEEYIQTNRLQKLRDDVIVRDVRRMDAYPESGTSRGISPWFRVGLVGTYHRGILLGLAWEELVEFGTGWRLPDWTIGERGTLKALRIGRVPYENIVDIDFEGDEYYGHPHIYCHFEGHYGGPYEDVGYYLERHINNHPYYTLIADHAEIRPNRLVRLKRKIKMQLKRWNKSAA